MEVGILLLVRLTIGCEYLSFQTPTLPLTLPDYEAKIGDKGDGVCNLLAPALCKIINADAFTVVVVIWSTLQLTWTTMLLFVQLVQISRAMTTYENMRSAHGHGTKASEAITSALTAGTTSLAGAQLGPSGHGPDPALPPTHAPHSHPQKQGWFTTMKKILGVDTFVETALGGYEGSRNARARKPRNPFSRGVIGNCKDFWCDPAPVFGKRENGAAMLGGEVINYTNMYETPLRMTMRPRSVEGGVGYERVETDDDVV